MAQRSRPGTLPLLRPRAHLRAAGFSGDEVETLLALLRTQKKTPSDRPPFDSLEQPLREKLLAHLTSFIKPLDRTDLPVPPSPRSLAGPPGDAGGPLGSAVASGTPSPSFTEGGSTCGEMGWYYAEEKDACDLDCGRECERKQWCGEGTCMPWPYYCWRCSGGGGGPQPPPPPGGGGAGEACRAAGFSTADDSRSFTAHHVRIYTVSEDFSFEGFDEGHDHRGSAVQEGGDWAPSICNVSWGTCRGLDDGCVAGYGGCSGRAGVDRTCDPGDRCYGRWTAQGYPSEWRPLSELVVTDVRGFTPFDCDCVSGTRGFPGMYTAVAANGHFEQTWSLSQSIAQVVGDAGRICGEGASGAVGVGTAHVCVDAGGAWLWALPLTAEYVPFSWGPTCPQ